MKIFHTADLHIGMKFKSYGSFAKNLADARTEQLFRLVDTANKEKCDLFAVSGDLFDNLYVSEKQIKAVCGALSDFSGAAAVVLPGNHDCFDGSGRLWNTFENTAGSNTYLLHTFEPLIIDSLRTAVHGAYCERAHSEKNHIADISPVDGFFNHALGHGSIERLSPDNERKYFPMKMRELEASPMDLWLVGHTHVRYPAADAAAGKIYNSGTPEPDGWDCSHCGNAWIIETGEEIRASAVQTGKYCFFDINETVSSEKDIDAIAEHIRNNSGENKILRVTLSGSCSEDFWNRREEHFEKIRSQACYIEEHYDNLHKQINANDIREEFPETSFPYMLLSHFFDDEQTLRIAYEAVKEATE